MRDRFIPRLECLETRQVPDAVPLLPVPAPPVMTAPVLSDPSYVQGASTALPVTPPAAGPADASGGGSPLTLFPDQAPSREDAQVAPLSLHGSKARPVQDNSLVTATLPPQPSGGPAQATGTDPGASPLARPPSSPEAPDDGSLRPRHPGKPVARAFDRLSSLFRGGLLGLLRARHGGGGTQAPREPEKPGHPAGGGAPGDASSFRAVQRGAFSSGPLGGMAPRSSSTPSGGGSAQTALSNDVVLSLFGPGRFVKALTPEEGDSTRGAFPREERGTPGNASALVESRAGLFALEGLALVSPSFWGAPPQTAPPPWVRRRGAKQPGQEGDGVSLTPVYLGVLPLPVGGKPLEPEAEGYRYLCGYAAQAIRAAERRAGPLRDHEDIIQQICLEWLEKAGPPDEAFPKLLKRSPPEMQLLRETVNRVIARVIYQQRKRLLASDFTDWPAPARPAERDWVEFKSDCERGVGSLTRQEWQILELRRQGKTFAEIGAEIALPRQRAWDIYQDVEARLQKIYRHNEV
jgi:hypothetical protein